MLKTLGVQKFPITPVHLPRIAQTIRGHWAIENSSHWVLDVTFREYDSRIRRGDAPENMTRFRRFAMNLARLSPLKDSMKGKLRQTLLPG